MIKLLTGVTIIDFLFGLLVIVLATWAVLLYFEFKFIGVTPDKYGPYFCAECGEKIAAEDMQRARVFDDGEEYHAACYRKGREVW